MILALFPIARPPGRGPVVLRIGVVLMLPWLIVLALLAIALCWTTPLSAVVVALSAVGITTYPPLPADCADRARSVRHTARIDWDDLPDTSDQGDYTEVAGCRRCTGLRVCEGLPDLRVAAAASGLSNRGARSR